MNCDKCGKDMSYRTGSLIGLSAGVIISHNNSDEENLFFKKQLGKYADKDNYNFCYECLIDAMMGK